MNRQASLPQPGQLFLGKYTIEQEVGRGSYGIVFRATQAGHPEPLAVKVLNPRLEQDEETRHRFKREAELASHLKSPHGVRTFDYGETPEGTPYMVMEYLEGKPLDEILKKQGPQPPERVASIIRQALMSLAEAHHLGIVHRDLKPANLFLCKSESGEDFVKVFDYGIAKVVGTAANPEGLQETTKLTAPGMVLGTPLYMSPEQCRGEVPTASSDLYSLGVVMFQMLSGEVPFDDFNPVQVLLMHNRQPVPPLPAPVADHPLAKVMGWALEKDVNNRITTATEFIQAIDQAMGTSGPLPDLSAVGPAKQASAEPAAEAGQRGGYLPLILGLLGVAAIIAIIVFVLSNSAGQ